MIARRAESVPDLLLDTRRSTNGRSSLALAIVVVIPSCNTSERASERKSAFRWRLSRCNVRVLTWCLIYRLFVVAKRESHVGKCALDVLQTLLTETFDR